MSKPQTIQIFLPAGNPRGVRMAEITTRIVRVFEVPRSLLDDFLRMPEAQQVGLYFLVGQEEDDAEARLYIGQSGSVGYRLVQHHEKKDFWTRALVAVSLTNSFTQTHGTFLEWQCLRQARQAARYVLENGNAGTKPHAPAPLEADCLEVFETIRTLVATLGQPLFEPVAQPVEATSSRELYFCTVSGVNAQGEYTPEGFVVLKGSVGRLKNRPTIEGKSGARTRQSLLDGGVMVPDGDSVRFTKDHLFKSAALAAMAVLGRSSAGWFAWRDASGRTLHEIKRQPGA